MKETNGEMGEHGGADSQALAETLARLTRAGDLAQVCAVLCQAARVFCGADAAVVVLREGNLCHYVDEESSTPLWKGQHFPSGSCVGGWAMSAGQPVAIADIHADPRLPGETLRPNFVKGMLMAPIATSAPLGALGVCWAGEHLADAEETRLLQALAAGAGASLERVTQPRAQVQGLRERAQARLREITRRTRRHGRQSFLDSLARQPNNPVTPIHNAVRLLKQGGNEGPEARGARDIGSGQLRQLAQAIADLLDLGRIERGNLRLRRERVELAALLDLVRRTALLEPEGQTLGLALPPEPIWLDADPARLARVLVNLLGPGARNCGERGRMAVTAEVDGDDVVLRLCVSDGGARAEPLTAFPQVLTRRAGGEPDSGLALAQGLLQLHGGDIEARDDLRGKEFVLRLPLHANPEAAPQVEPEAGARILLASADPEFAAALAMLLELCGNTVITAGDGLDAVATAQRERPDLALLDLGLPRLDGFRVGKRLRKQARSADLRIVALADWGREVAPERLRDAGIDHCLAKPTPAAELRNLLAEAATDGAAAKPHDDRLDAALRQAAMSEQSLAALLATSPDAILSIDAGRRVAYFNPAAEALFQCSAATALGQPVTRFIPDGLRGAAPQQALDLLGCAAPARTRVALGNQRGLRGDGTAFPIEAAISQVDAGGGLLATLVVRDASHQAELEAAVAAGRDRLAYVSEAAGVGYWDWDIAGDRLEWSPRFKALCGIPETEPMSYKRFLASVHPDERDRVYGAVHAALDGVEDYDIEYRTRWPDGQVRWVHARGRASFGGDGQAQRLGGIAFDVSARHELEAALRESELRLRDLTDTAPAMLWMTDAAGAGSFLNRAWYEYIGQPAATARSDAWIEALHPEDRKTVADHFHPGNSRHDPFQNECRIRRGEEDYHWVLVAGRPRFDGDGAFLGYIGSLVDIDGRKNAERHIREAALHDPVTGLPNRALIFEYGSHQLAAAQRRHGGVALLFVVLNRFKTINLRYGRDSGDAVLQEVARRLGEFTRHEDMVGRLGGDEFVILLPHLDANRHRAAIVAKHVLECIARPIQLDGHELVVTPSVGISCYPEHGIDMKGLIRAADLAMNQAKHTRRANYLFYSRDLEHHADEARQLEAQLRNALKEGNLMLHYQPVIDIKSGRLIAAEALVRMLGNTGETIAPQRFIRIAESLGLIGELDEWVAATACRQHGEWQRQGFQGIAVAVNTSHLEFQHQDFPDRLGRILADAGMDPAHFQLELSESTLQSGSKEVLDSLQRIKALGVQVAVDEFGSGDTDLNLLTNLPIDLLKIDPAFVRRLEFDETSLAVAKSIIALGHHLSLEVVGEGIESEATLRHLRESGCNRAQGFLVSRPLPADEFAHWCRNYTH